MKVHLSIEVNEDAQVVLTVGTSEPSPLPRKTSRWLAAMVVGRLLDDGSLPPGETLQAFALRTLKEPRE